MNKYLLFLLLSGCMLATTTVAAQALKGGFKAGLNFSRFQGPSETDDSGKELESYDFNTGFHIGVALALPVTDLFGFKADILYSQKGSQYSYDGPSYFVFYTPNDQPIYSLGNRQTDLEVTNTYLDIPLMAYVRLGRLELGGGINGAILLSSQATGGIVFSGQTTSGSTIAPLAVTLEYNYLRDDSGPSAILSSENLTLDGVTVLRPTTLGAYYESGNEMSDKYRRFDAGLVGDVSFFINQGLFLGFRLNYGLLDVTLTEQDLSARRLDNRQFVPREDQDRNVSLQAALGFRF